MFFATHCKRRIFLFETCCIICHYYWKRTAFQHLVYIRFLYVCSILSIKHFLEIFISPHSGHLPAVMRYRGTHFEEVFPRALQPAVQLFLQCAYSPTQSSLVFGSARSGTRRINPSKGSITAWVARGQLLSGPHQNWPDSRNTVLSVHSSTPAAGWGTLNS